MTTFEQIVGYEFKDSDLLQQAFTHKSYHNERETRSKGHNERLEFLGDAVLDLALSDYLMHSYPEVSEGDLSKIRASLVNEAILAELAREFKMDEDIRLGRGEKLTGGATKPRLLASAFEAVIGAYYLDAGFDPAKALIEKVFSPRIRLLDPKMHYATDYKTRLQEILQERHRRAPSYKLLREEGPDHDKVFYVTVHLADELLGEGEGKSKKQAEQDAARHALEQLI